MLELVGIQDARPECWDLHILNLIEVGLGVQVSCHELPKPAWIR